MNTKTENPPAFPSTEYGQPNQDYPIHFHGMSLRDWFAGQALVGLVELIHVDNSKSFQIVANLTYSLADAMLTAREKSHD